MLDSAIDKNDIPDLEYDEEISPLVADGKCVFI